METEIPELLELLVALKGQEFFQIFVDRQINAESLKYLDRHHLDQVLPNCLYGPRVIFEYHLRKWQQENNIDVYSSLEVPARELVIPTNGPDIFEEEHVDEISIDGVLNTTLAGKQILEFYSKNKFLNSKYRNLLTNCMVEYLIEKKVKPSPKSFEIISQKISYYFTNESKDIYYVAIKCKKPAGSLYAKYHNSISKLRKEGLMEPSSRINKKRKLMNSNELSPEIPSPDQICNKDWLKYNIEPIDEVLLKWDNTYELRKTYILNGEHTLSQIFEEWPLLKQSFGYKLIESDFANLYPEKKDLLFVKWEEFFPKVLLLISQQVKNPEILESVNELKGTKYNTDVRNGVILLAIHYLLKPTSRKCSVDEVTKKRTYSKASVVDSINAFWIISPTSCELQSKIKLLTDSTFEKKERLQPLICCIGSSVFDLSEYYIYYATVYYKFENILKCLDVAFKIFHVLNLEYPANCKNVYLFFQQYFYTINLKSSEKSTKLSSVLNDIQFINI